ncbi:restriction endonuclease subunit S [Pseudomonas guariconensis]|uniref:restriction endonuclease subunit S n=1 Tax=Pseudomonas guariconensis TaxID=1288410 RepID=UPI0018A88677|nr:restriction endonuclease subunit S [Pseudomonas guariconensis]MBF8755541.1 restriction endonuclease subunit S [Pseudomonas guariconensis]
MSAVLTDNLPLLAGAPNGIKKLRELILELAVRGKLVPQDPNDEPASELLKRIAEEKARLLAEGQIKKTKPLAAMAEEDQPFELPAGWKWASTAALTLLITDGTHHTPTYINSGVPFISVKDIDGATISFDNCKYISQEEHVAINTRCNPELGDILLCRIGTLGRPTIVDTEVPFSLFVSVGLLKLPKKTEFSRYFHCVLSSPLMYRQYDQIKAGGSHTNKLNLGDIPRLLVPVPPLAEQHRIVAKVDELMALCDRLEARQTDAESAHAQLVQELLSSLVQACDAEDFAQSWQRLAEHFHTLFTTESSIDALKQSLLQLAVMGKLVPQDPNDEPASELLKRIAESSAKLVAGTKAKKGSLKAGIAVEGINGIGLPPTWLWVPFDDLINPEYPIAYGVLVPGPDVVDGIPFVRIADLDLVAPPVKPEKSISPEVDSQFERTRIRGGEILMGVVGSVGKLGIAPDTWAGANIARAICRIVPCGYVSKSYILWLLQSDLMRRQFLGDTRTLAQPTLNVGLIRSASTPLPPLAEQHRIIAKVDQLMALCDQLKARLNQARQVHEHLASALVEQAVA